MTWEHNCVFLRHSDFSQNNNFYLWIWSKTAESRLKPMQSIFMMIWQTIPSNRAHCHSTFLSLLTHHCTYCTPSTVIQYYTALRCPLGAHKTQGIGSPLRLSLLLDINKKGKNKKRTGSCSTRPSPVPKNILKQKQKWELASASSQVGQNKNLTTQIRSSCRRLNPP